MLPKTYAHFKEKWTHVSEEHLKLLPSWERIKETKLPPQLAYFSQLTGKGISDEDWKFANKSWDTFNLKYIGQFQDLYMTTDVTLLADSFE